MVVLLLLFYACHWSNYKQKEARAEEIEMETYIRNGLNVQQQTQIDHIVGAYYQQRIRDSERRVPTEPPLGLHSKSPAPVALSTVAPPPSYDELFPKK